MDTYFFVKTLHILSSTILFGTGIGIAFFMFRSFCTNDLHEKLYAARSTVVADYLFTFPAAIVQPITGLWFNIWFALGWPAFVGLVAAFFLMVVKPI
jgi:uncharacterized membrane protein